MMRVFKINGNSKSHQEKFLHAAKNGSLYQVKECIIHGVNKDAKDSKGWTALHYACLNGYLNIVQYLIEACRVEKDATTNSGWTALHRACFNGHLDVVKYLIETCHIDQEANNNVGQTAYDIARKYNKTSVAEYLKTAQAYSTKTKVNSTESGNASISTNDVTVVTDQTNDAAASLQSEGETLSITPNSDTVPVICPDMDGTASIESDGKASSLTANLDSICSTDILIQNSDSNKASSPIYEMNENWMSKLQDENQQLIDKLNEIDNCVQYIDERRDIIDLLVVEKCNTIEEQNEQSAILASPLHRDFYILLQRKLKCMIKSCETLSTSMVGAGGGDFRSFTARTIREKGCNVLRETKLGFFIGNAVTWAKKNLAVVPFIDTVGSVFQLIVTLKDEHDRYLGLARVADFATMVCFQQYGSTSLDTAVEKLARFIVRARCGLPPCKFVEETDEFGKFKQLMINLLADSGDTPAKEQASKAADCAFAHIMKPGKDSALYDVLYGDTFDVGLDEALAASILGITLDDLREFDSFTITPQTGIPSSTDTNNRPRVFTTNTPNMGLNGASLHVDSFASSDVVAEQEAKIQQQNEMIQKQDETIQMLSRQFTCLEKKLKQSNSKTDYDAGDGLVYANPAEQFTNEITSLQIDNVVLDQRLRDQATIIDNYESRITDLEKQILGAGRPLIETNRGMNC